MSESVYYRWRLEAQRRRQAYLDRIRVTTSRYHARYEGLLADLVSQGLEQYLPEEFSRVRSSLQNLKVLITSDPERARDVSLQLGAEISRLPALARAARREFESRERQRQKEVAEMRRKATSELAQYLQSLLTDIRDPIERDFAFDSVRAIQAEYNGRVVDAQELSTVKQKLQVRYETICREASAKAKEWKSRKAQETLKESLDVLLDIHRGQAEADAGRNPEAILPMMKKLDALRQQSADAALSLRDLQKEIAMITEKTDAAVADENCRRTVVRAIMDSLEKSGFVVDKPKRQTGAQDEVVILARKPAGAQAFFRVTADGTMVYKFDQYEGMKCKSDIDQVLPTLQGIYGVELSDARILWQNPDRASRSAKPMDMGNKEQRHGK